MKTIEELQEEMNRIASQLNALPKYKAIVLIPTEPTPSSEMVNILNTILEKPLIHVQQR